MPTSLNKGRPVVVDEPQSEVSQAIAQLAARFSGVEDRATSGDFTVIGSGDAKKKKLFGRKTK